MYLVESDPVSSSVEDVLTCQRCDRLEDKITWLLSVMTAAGIDPALTAPSLVEVEQESFGDDLTARQLEVGKLLAEGKTNAEIAERLYLGVNSIKTHVKALYRAIGVRNRTEAALWFVRHGEIEL